MIEICYINSSLNIVAMLLLVYYFVNLYIHSNSKGFDGIVYFIIIATCALRIGTEIHLLIQPTNDTIEVFIPLFRNFAFVYFARKHLILIKKK